MAEVPIENIIRKAKDQYNSGDMLAARQSCLQALAKNPGNPEALHLFGAVNYSGLRNPFREMLLLLKKISLDPQFDWISAPIPAIGPVRSERSSPRQKC